MFNCIPCNGKCNPLSICFYVDTNDDIKKLPSKKINLSFYLSRLAEEKLKLKTMLCYV